jgi:hypothetical protein
VERAVGPLTILVALLALFLFRLFLALDGEPFVAQDDLDVVFVKARQFRGYPELRVILEDVHAR